VNAGATCASGTMCTGGVCQVTCQSALTLSTTSARTSRPTPPTAEHATRLAPRARAAAAVSVR